MNLENKVMLGECEMESSETNPFLSIIEAVGLVNMISPFTWPKFEAGRMMNPDFDEIFEIWC